MRPTPATVLRALLAASALFVLAPAAPALAACPGSSDSGCSVTQLGKQGRGVLRQSQAVALAANGDVYVGDRWGYAVQRFAADGTFLGEWGEYGTGEGQFAAVGGLGVDGAANVYVLDSGSNRVQKFDASGRFLASWGGRGSDGTGPQDLNLGFKGDLVVSGDSVYVADAENHRVVRFDTDGRHRAAFGSRGTGPAQFAYPMGLDVDGAGNLYVADDQNDRIQKLTADGAFLAEVGSSGSADGQFQNPYDVAVDGSGNLYVADNLNHRVQKFDSALGFVAKWGGRGTGPGQLTTPRSLTVDAGGTSFVTDTGNDRMQRFGSDGALLGTFGESGRQNGNLTGPQGMDIDRDGNLVIADTLEYWMQKLTTDGAFLTKWGGHGSGSPRLFQLPADVAAERSGAMEVTDTFNDRVDRFDASTTFVEEKPGFLKPRGVGLDASDQLYVADTGNHRVQKLSGGAVAATFGAPGSGSGQLTSPEDVALDAAGNLYVADTGNHRVQKFDAAGRAVAVWGSRGTGDGQFEFPSGVEVDPEGNLWVMDSGNARAQRFSPSGTFLTKVGERGHGPGQLWPSDPTISAARGRVTTDPAGNLYVSDPYNNRILKYTFTGPRTKEYAPVDYALAAGSVYNGLGAASRMAGNDGQYVEINRAKVGSAYVAEIQPRATISSFERNALDKLTVAYDGNATSTSPSMTLHVYNFERAAWETIDGPRAATTGDRALSWSNQTNPKAYVSAAGEVRASVRATQSSSKSYRTRTDLVRFSVEY